jgi:glycyl-tRNA synthetase alpha subunit
VTERTAYILKVRQLAVAICRRYAEECAAAEAAAAEF